ncbi:MFS transporter, partial [Shewanella sp. 0m-11]
GLFIVPLYTYIQARAKEGECAQAIACNNIINALFMVSSAIFSMLVLNVLQWPIERLFLVLAASNLVVLLLLLWRWPELFLRVASYFIRRIKHKTQLLDPELLHQSSRLLVVTKSLSWRDILLIYGSFTHPMLFAPSLCKQMKTHRFLAGMMSRLCWHAGENMQLDSLVCVDQGTLTQLINHTDFADFKLVAVKTVTDNSCGNKLTLAVTPLAANSAYNTMSASEV